jgi:integrase
MTVGQVCDWYLIEAEAGRLLGRRRRPIAAATLMLDRSRIKTHVKPLLGNRVARGLTIGDLERFQADIAAGRTARVRTGRGGRTTGGAGVAGRTLGMLHTIFEQASRWGLLEANPARGARKIEGDKRRERRLSESEVQRLGKAMVSQDESPVAIAAIKLMLLTGFRRMEVLGLRHDWVDANVGCVRFPATKSGAQIRLVGTAAMQLITSQRHVGPKGFVFPGEAGNDHFVGILRVLERLSLAADIERLTPHVLRHSFASFAADLGFSEMTVGSLLGHAARGVTQRYIHLDKAVQMAANDTAAHLSAMLDHCAPD